MKDKMKVVWICHFSNAQVRKNISLYSKTFENIGRKLFNEKPKEYLDFAPWVINMVVEFEQFSDVELHIVAPHTGMKKEIDEFSLNGINYHFFKIEKLFPFNKIDNLFNKRTKNDFVKNRRFIKKIVEEIKPDIVNLIGAENPYYSIAALDVKNIPIVLSCQTVYSNPQRAKLEGRNINKLRWDTEQKIFQHIDYFFCPGRMYYDLLKLYKPNSYIFPFNFPSMKVKDMMPTEKNYDFVWFAQSISIKKGIVNAIEALKIVKKKYNNISLLVVGSCDVKMMNFFNDLIEKHNLKDNVIYHAPFPKHEDLLQYISQAKYALLPNKIDVISGTILESMTIGLPVVTHITSGTPLINKNKECVLLSEIDDIEALADNMRRLMESNELADTLIVNAKEWVNIKRGNNNQMMRKVVDNYKLIIDNYNGKKEIPIDVLFNVNDYPEYM